MGAGGWLKKRMESLPMNKTQDGGDMLNRGVGGGGHHCASCGTYCATLQELHRHFLSHISESADSED